MTAPQSDSPGATRKPLPAVVPARVIRLARLRGEVVPLSPQFDNCVRFRGYWWIDDGTEWIRLTEPEWIKALDLQHAEYTARYQKHAVMAEELRRRAQSSRISK